MSSCRCTSCLGLYLDHPLTSHPSCHRMVIVSHIVKSLSNSHRHAATVNPSPLSPMPLFPRQLCFPFLAHILHQISNQVPTSWSCETLSQLCCYFILVWWKCHICCGFWSITHFLSFVELFVLLSHPFHVCFSLTRPMFWHRQEICFSYIKYSSFHCLVE